MSKADGSGRATSLASKRACAIAAVLFLFVLSGCGGGTSDTATTGSTAVETAVTTGGSSTSTSVASPGHSIRGVFTLTVDEQLTKGAECEGPPPYDDLRGGAPVVVKNEAGEEVGRGTLDVGRAPEESFGPTTPICEFTFDIGDLPDVDSYTISINHVDDQTFTAVELEDQGWTVEFGLAMAISG